MQHWGDLISVLEEHPKTLPKSERCGVQVPAGRLSNCHYTSEKCKQEEEIRLKREALQRCFKETRVSFQINSNTLPLSEAFPYLVRTIT